MLIDAIPNIDALLARPPDRLLKLCWNLGDVVIRRRLCWRIDDLDAVLESDALDDFGQLVLAL